MFLELGTAEDGSRGRTIQRHITKSMKGAIDTADTWVSNQKLGVFQQDCRKV